MMLRKRHGVSDYGHEEPEDEVRYEDADEWSSSRGGNEKVLLQREVSPEDSSIGANGGKKAAPKPLFNYKRSGEPSQVS